MFFKFTTATMLATAVALIPAERVEADAGDFIAGAIIGGVIGANVKKQRRTTTTRRTTTRRATTRRSSIPSTQEGRQIQASLNYFGFNAGSVDGQLGRKSRDAVMQYQAYLGYPMTGQLTPFEQSLLINSWNRAQAGGVATNQLIAANADGTRGLLKTYRAEMAGQQSPTVLAAVPQPQAAPQAVVAAPAVTAAAAAPSNGLPSFIGAGTQASLASHCNTVSLVTNTNGGFVTLAGLTDPNTALNEQFCLARTYAIAESEEMASRISGFTPDQIAVQCAGFGPPMKEHVAALAMKPRQTITAEVGNFAIGTGMAPAQLAATAKICMGVGYRTDNMDVAVGSALLLFSLGDHVYGELMGHHLSQGFGPARNVANAASWYQAGFDALAAGATPVFNPGQPERTDLLRQAAAQLSGAPALPAVQPASSLPTFSISK